MLVETRRIEGAGRPSGLIQPAALWARSGPLEFGRLRCNAQHLRTENHRQAESECAIFANDAMSACRLPRLPSFGRARPPGAPFFKLLFAAAVLGASVAPAVLMRTAAAAD